MSSINNPAVVIDYSSGKITREGVVPPNWAHAIIIP